MVDESTKRMIAYQAEKYDRERAQNRMDAMADMTMLMTLALLIIATAYFFAQGWM